MKTNKLKKINLGLRYNEVNLLGCDCHCFCTPYNDPGAIGGTTFGVSMNVGQATQK